MIRGGLNTPRVVIAFPPGHDDYHHYGIVTPDRHRRCLENLSAVLIYGHRRLFCCYGRALILLPVLLSNTLS